MFPGIPHQSGYNKRLRAAGPLIAAAITAQQKPAFDPVWGDFKPAFAAAQRWRSTLVLKGPGTIVEQPQGRSFVNPTGSVALATGGTGDVLTGVTAAVTLPDRWTLLTSAASPRWANTESTLFSHAGSFRNR